MKSRGRAGFSSKISKRNKRRRTFKLALFVALPIAVLAGLVFFLRLSVFQIQNIEVVGAVTLSQEQIKSIGAEYISGAYLGVIPRSNILFADTHKLEDSIKSTFGKVESVKIDRNADGNLKIKIKEKTAVALWCRAEDCFLLDHGGVVYARASESEKAGKVVFSGAIGGDPIGKQLMGEEEMGYYFALVEKLGSAGIETSQITLESADKTILRTSLCDIVVLPEERDAGKTAENLLLLVDTERKKNGEVRFEYIDARFMNKMFYKIN